MIITIHGKAGQGIQLVAKVLANILTENSFNVALTLKYSPLMRFGESNAYLIFSKEKIENPLIEKADIVYDVFKEKDFNNMLFLGKILKKLNLRLDEKQLIRYLPKKSLNENLKNIKNGYNTKN